MVTNDNNRTLEFTTEKVFNALMTTVGVTYNPKGIYLYVSSALSKLCKSEDTYAHYAFSEHGELKVASYSDNGKIAYQSIANEFEPKKDNEQLASLRTQLSQEVDYNCAASETLSNIAVILAESDVIDIKMRRGILGYMMDGVLRDCVRAGENSSYGIASQSANNVKTWLATFERPEE